MTIRYSGDTEVRDLRYEGNGVYTGTVADRAGYWHGPVRVPLLRGERPRSSEAYDHAAEDLLARADRWRLRRGRPRFDAERVKTGGYRIRRVFQAPCPSG